VFIGAILGYPVTDGAGLSVPYKTALDVMKPVGARYSATPLI
jgi:hypothetical protein